MASTATIHSQRSLRDIAYPTLDAICIFGSMGIVKWMLYGYFDENAKIAAGTAVLLFLLVSQVTCLHRRWRSLSSNEEVLTISLTWGLTLALLGVLGFATRSVEIFSRIEIICWATLAPSIIALLRMIGLIIQQSLRSNGIGTRRVAIAGYNRLGFQVAESIQRDPSLGLSLIGFYDDRFRIRSSDDSTPESEQGDEEKGLQGSLESLFEKVQQGDVDIVMVTLPMRAESRIRNLLDQLSDSTASVYIVPDFFVFELLHSRWTSVGGLPAVSVFENPLYGVDGLLKRCVDLCLALAALVLCTIPMLLIAIAIRLTSPGPIFFRQSRYGFNGEEIRVWKFRSMRVQENGPEVRQATKGDPRVTPLGSILRRTSLDELPQLFNVISGSMSLVGPRPHANAHNEQYRKLIRGYMLRHKVKPGITGLAQVSGCRGETDTVDKMQQRIAMDHRYIRTWSLWLDLRILLKTLVVAWRQPEAY